jgi:hypothetical protein
MLLLLFLFGSVIALNNTNCDSLRDKCDVFCQTEVDDCLLCLGDNWYNCCTYFTVCQNMTLLVNGTNIM